MASRWRRTCFTSNNYTEASIELLELLPARAECVCLCYGKEIANSGTPHLQGYVEWSQPLPLGRWRKLLPPGSHVEQANGSRKANHTYCSKDGRVTLHPSDDTFWTGSVRAPAGAYGPAMEAIQVNSFFFFFFLYAPLDSWRPPAGSLTHTMIYNIVLGWG